MSISSIHHHHSTQPQAVSTPSRAEGVPTPTAGPVTVPQGDDPTGPAPTGDGPVLVSLKQSLAAQGFSASNTVAGSDDAHAALHGFTHAFFDSVQAQRQADAAAGTPTTMRSAIHQLSDQAAAGNAPADLQSAFDTLQQTQAPGSPAASASLSQVLSGMAATAPHHTEPVGSLVDASA